MNKLRMGIIIIVAIVMTPSIFAVTPGQENKTSFPDARSNLRQVLQERTTDTQNFFGVRMNISLAKVTAIRSSTLTVEKDGIAYTVNTGTFNKCITQYRRRFWGKGSISDIAVGHRLNIFGKWANDAKTSLNACVIRDLSIQKRYGVFYGTILAVTSQGFTMSTASEKRDDQTVTVSTTAKLINRKEQSIRQGDIQVGHKVRVSGLWDNEQNTVTEVTRIKDFTLPIVPTPTPKS